MANIMWDTSQKDYFVDLAQTESEDQPVRIEHSNHVLLA